MQRQPFKKKFYLVYALLGILVIFAVAEGGLGMSQSVTKDNLQEVLSGYVGSSVPGLQYIVVDANETRFAYAGGWADVANKTPMTLQTTMMAYSMTKTLTAVAVLQLVEQGKLNLGDEIDKYLPDTPYAGHHITVRHLLAHTSGLPNPIPIRWAHLVEEDSSFDEDAALAQVMYRNSKLAFEPGEKFAYNNIGYWLLGKILEKVTGQPYSTYVETNILERLNLSERDMNFTIPDAAHHANGYLTKYSVMNFIKGFVMDKKFFGSHEGKWLRLKSHHLDGPAFGGLVGTARSFALFLQDQLHSESVLLSKETKALLESQQTDSSNNLIPMTLGWHVGETQGVPYFFKEGGGGGFHAEMRLYATQGIASVVMVNNTQFDSRAFLNRVDSAFIAHLTPAPVAFISRQ
jgi:D-alanyl-D-alanine carboxypeptidase